MAPPPDYHWCPGEFWHPEWGFNWGGDRCHDDFYFDGEARDRGHWHGRGDWRPGF
ncbi:Secreted protein antigen [Mycolicibacterium neworleansense]|uniref:Pilin n=2 Tax=Mycolicibacterium neworleansense TaxID=146018 RepID=A0A0H5RJV9_9MYCO|nr:Secreted protein antigen [Mycolicibacterium neworleansense]